MFGSILRKARTRARLTQKQVAAQTDTSSQYISSLERDAKDCTIATLKRLDKVLRFPQRDLIRIVRCDEPAP